MMRGSRRVENPFGVLSKQELVDLFLVPGINGFPQLFLAPDEVTAIVGSYPLGLTSSRDNEGVGV